MCCWSVRIWTLSQNSTPQRHYDLKSIATPQLLLRVLWLYISCGMNCKTGWTLNCRKSASARTCSSIFVSRWGYLGIPKIAHATYSFHQSHCVWSTRPRFIFRNISAAIQISRSADYTEMPRLWTMFFQTIIHPCHPGQQPLSLPFHLKTFYNFFPFCALQNSREFDLLGGGADGSEANALSFHDKISENIRNITKL